MSAKHLNRYVNEFSGRHNQRSRNTVDQISAISSRAGHRKARLSTQMITAATIPCG